MKMSASAKRKINKLLADFWRDQDATTNRLSTMTISALYAAIDTEREGERRKSVLQRLHQVLCKKRAAQERQRLLGKFKEWRL